MFSIFSSKKAIPFSPEERAEMLRLLRLVEDTRFGAFLHLIDLGKVIFRWNPSMDVRNGVLGSFSALRPNTIDLAPGASPHAAGEYPFGRILDLAPTAMHELEHMFQLRQAPLSFLVDGLPVIREAPWSTEPDARKVEEEAEKFYSSERLEIEGSWRTAP
jgi:hypothetical protein